jgi:DNA-binding IclR family transcriptional regulator
VTERTITDPGVFARELERVARDGFATEVEEFSPGVACVSVPVHRHGTLVGSYTISAPVERYRRQQEQFLACLRAAVAMVGETG